MKTYTLPSGNIMPGFGLGTWKSDPGVVGASVIHAINIGYRHIDCAAIYGNEAEIGQALTTLFTNNDSGIKRDDIFLTSKLWNANHSPDDVEPALRKTLADLKVDCLDLYLMHWPVAMGSEGQMISLDELPLIDTWRAMEACVDNGLVKDIGVSNFSKKKLQELCGKARIRPAVNQIELHPYLQMRDLLDYATSEGIHLTAYSPLGSRDRPDWLKSEKEVPILDDEDIALVAKKHNVTPAQVLIAWALERGTSVIPKSVSEHRLKENLEAAATTLQLDQDDMQSIAKMDRHARYVDGSFWCREGSPYSMETLWDEPDTSSSA
jgi:alcohol dehydrogenase (NADP+)